MTNPPARGRRFRLAALGFTAAVVGSLALAATGRPALAMVAVALLGIPAARMGQAPRAGRAALVGAAVGLVGAFAIVFTLNQLRNQQAFRSGPPASRPAAATQALTRPATATAPAWQFHQEWAVADRELAAIGIVTVTLCGTIAGLFAHVAQSRGALRQ